MFDYHLHLLRHGEDGPYTRADVRAYAEAAAARGVSEICLTEHLFRFRQADGLLAGWWDADPDGVLREQTAAYWAEHATGDLDAYAGAVLEAAGEPSRAGDADRPRARILLGLEVDYYPGRMDEVRRPAGGLPLRPSPRLGALAGLLGLRPARRTGRRPGVGRPGGGGGVGRLHRRHRGAGRHPHLPTCSPTPTWPR